MTRDLSWLHSLPGKPIIVAEMKDLSPFSGWINPLPPDYQLARCEALGHVVSVHTNEWWGGSWDRLEYVCERASKPVLAKGFHPTAMDVKRAFDCGATFVLTVGWWPGDERCWHEVETRDQLINTGAKWIVLNSRNPRTGERRIGLDIAPVRVVNSVDSFGRKLCQASNIHGPEDVISGVQAILIGEGLYT